MKNTCVVTSSRADYGILKPLIKRLHDDRSVNLSVVATGTHLCPEFGNTYTEIESDGFVIDKKFDIQLSSDTSASMSKTMGIALICFADYFKDNPPDLLIVLGDRYEMAAVCCAAYNQRIPIAHIHGGETTEGAIDEAYRHSITKMSALHFTSCEVYRKRVIQLGEQPDKVFNVGALGVENALNSPVMPLAELECDIGFDLSGSPFAVVTFHPVTLENDTEEKQFREITKAMDAFPNMKFIITKSNADAGGGRINRLWDGCGKNRDNCYITESLGMLRYLSAIKHAAVVIGNSSSGILEAPACKVPTVNIGDRQKGRIAADSVISCEPTAAEIETAIKKAISPEFRQFASNAHNPYGDGQTSERIVDTVKRFLTEGISLKKTFYDCL